MATREPIDALLDALSQVSDQTTDTEVQNNVRQDQVSHRDANNDNSTGQPSTPTQSTSPRSIRRMIRYTRILSSSSLKKKQIKSVACRYCNRFKFGRKQIEDHLNQFEVCLALYEREFKVKSLDAVLSKMFRCISCGAQGNFQLKRHLGWLVTKK